jgi:hypothetical protein
MEIDPRIPIKPDGNIDWVKFRHLAQEYVSALDFWDMTPIEVVDQIEAGHRHDERIVAEIRKRDAELLPIGSTFPKNKSHVKNKNLGGRPADEKGYKAAFLYMTEKKCSLDEAFSWWKVEYQGQMILRSYSDMSRIFKKGIKYWLNKPKT